MLISCKVDSELICVLNNVPKNTENTFFFSIKSCIFVQFGHRFKETGTKTLRQLPAAALPDSNSTCCGFHVSGKTKKKSKIFSEAEPETC